VESQLFWEKAGCPFCSLNQDFGAETNKTKIAKPATEATLAIPKSTELGASTRTTLFHPNQNAGLVNLSIFSTILLPQHHQPHRHPRRLEHFITGFFDSAGKHIHKNFH